MLCFNFLFLCVAYLCKGKLCNMYHIFINACYVIFFYGCLIPLSYVHGTVYQGYNILFYGTMEHTSSVGVCVCVWLKAVLNRNDCILNFCAVLCVGFVPSAHVKVSICLNQPNWHPEDGDSKFPQNSEQTHYTAQCIKPKDDPPPPWKTP
jgi:hypothetical protein